MRKGIQSIILALIFTTTLQAQVKKSAPKGKTSPKTVTSSTNTSATIITLGTHKIPSSEFSYVYNKNNSNAEDAYTEASVREYLDLYIKFKLKVMDAEAAGLDTTKAFIAEFEGYKKQLAKPYLVDKSVTEKLIREAYERLKDEINASHILISVDPNASPKDTLEAYNKALEYRRRLLAGADFAKLAQEVSQDPSAKYNGGNLGYFTALQMVYPFEDAAYKLPKDAISMPVRTRFGYHLIKVLGRRPSQGQVTVAHIMVKANPGMAEEDSIAAKEKIDEIYERLTKKKEDFAMLCAEFSDDQGSKGKGGVLPTFGTGNMIPQFEEAAFALKDSGDISKPVLTQYGWHIIKLINKRPLEKFEDIRPTLEQKVSKDSRSELNKSIFIARLRKEYNVTENAEGLKFALSKADSSLVKGTWDYKADDAGLTKTILTIKNNKFTVGDFFEYVKKSQATQKVKSPEVAMRNLFKEFSEKEILKFEEENLPNKYEDYRMLLKEYREGILLFTMMDNKVWSKAIEDTAGLKQFHAANKSKYRWDTRADVVIYSAANQAVLDDVKAKLSAGMFEAAEPRFNEIVFDKAKSVDLGAFSTQIKSMADALKRDKTLKLEINAYAAADEKSSVSLQRLTRIADSLVSRGVSKDRLILKDNKKSGSKADASKFRKLSFKVYATTNKALERAINANAPLSLQVTEGLFQKDENKTLDMLDKWTVGEHIVRMNDRIHLIVIKAIEPPREKTFDEAKGAVISDYQNYLEEAWINELKAKYPVSVNEAEVQKLIRK
jgi:peptidyl-prolyl cis-trans isomerase SurA